MARRTYLYMLKGVWNVVSFLDSGSSSTWWYPLNALKVVKCLHPVGIVWTTSHGECLGFSALLTYLFNILRSMQSWMLSSFLGATIIGWSQLLFLPVGTCSIRPRLSWSSSSIMSFSMHDSGTVRDDTLLNRMDPSSRSMTYYPPAIVGISVLSKTFRNSFAILSSSGPWPSSIFDVETALTRCPHLAQTWCSASSSFFDVSISEIGIVAEGELRKGKVLRDHS